MKGKEQFGSVFAVHHLPQTLELLKHRRCCDEEKRIRTEIAEQKRKARQEENQNARKMMAYMMGGLFVMMTATMLVGKIIGWY